MPWKSSLVGDRMVPIYQTHDFLKEMAIAHLRDDSRITDRHGNALHDAAAADQEAGADPLPRSDRSDEYHRHYLIFRSYSPFMAFKSSAFAHSVPSRRQIHHRKQ